jgi:hypothetical protein
MKRIVLSAALAASTFTVARAQEDPTAVVVPAPAQSVKAVTPRSSQRQWFMGRGRRPMR